MYSKNLVKRLNLRLSESDYLYLLDVCKRYHITPSQFLRNIILSLKGGDNIADK